MKQSLPILLSLTLLVLSLTLTGFQCGSSEMTSAKLYMSQGNFERADTSLMKEVQKNPQNGEAWYLLGRLRLDQGSRVGKDMVPKFKEMLADYDKSLAITKEFEPKIIEDRKFAWVKAVNEGVALYNRSAKTSPESTKALQQDAINAYQLAISIAPDSVMPYENMAIAYQALGNYDEQIATLNEVMKRKPSVETQTSLINAYLLKAQAAEVNGKKEDATTDYNHALAILSETRKTDPNNEELLKTTIDLYVRLNRANEAMPFIREAIQRDPSNKIYQYNLGVLLMQGDKLDEAIGHFEAALKTDPAYEPALQNIAVAHMKMGDNMKKAAQEAAEKNKKATPDKSYIEHFKKAAGYFEQLVKIKPDEPNYWDYLGSAYANANMLKEAKDAITKADALRKK